jgi:16S rRNA C967 or C1407 C5-methylase (RsmB/RsmF family)
MNLTPQTGEAAFDAAYSALYGGRWDGLKAALRAEKDLRVWQYPGRGPYLLDSASILAALSLPLSGAKKILDCCAAPGGKAVVLASVMDRDAALRANDRSGGRVKRLRATLRDCLPPEILARVSVTATDAARLARRHSGSAPPPEDSRFDAILLDAPCSSERYILASSAHLSRWSPGRTRNLAVAQWSLLSAAFRLLKPGGALVYATCALQPAENDGAVLRLLKKFPEARLSPQAAVPPQAASAQAAGFFSGGLPAPEKTETGFLFLPDVCAGAGPLFFACIQKADSEEPA